MPLIVERLVLRRVVRSSSDNVASIITRDLGKVSAIVTIPGKVDATWQGYEVFGFPSSQVTNFHKLLADNKHPGRSEYDITGICRFPFDHLGGQTAVRIDICTKI